MNHGPRHAFARPSIHLSVFIVCLMVVIASSVLRLDGRQGVAIGSFVLPESCLLQRCVGLPCAACGMTRSFVAIAGGQWQSGFAFHPLGPILYLLVVAQVPWRVVQLYRVRHNRPPLRWPGATMTISLLLLTALVRWIVGLV